MQFILILTTFVYFTTRMNLVQAINGSENTCPCVMVSDTKVHHSKIKAYTIQKEGVCLFNAIVFQTVRGKKICSVPNDNWAKNVIQQLEKRQNEKVSTPGSELISTPTTAHGSEQTSSPTTALGSEQTSKLRSSPSTPTSASVSESVPPSTTTLTFSTTPEKAPSATTLTPISAKSTPNLTSAPNNIAGASGTRSACDRILVTSPTIRKAST